MSLEEAKKAWEKNWEFVDPVLDYRDVVSVVHWAEHVDLVEGKTLDGLSFPLSLCPKEQEISLESTLQHLANSQEWLNKVYEVYIIMMITITFKNKLFIHSKQQTTMNNN